MSIKHVEDNIFISNTGKKINEASEEDQQKMSYKIYKKLYDWNQYWFDQTPLDFDYFGGYVFFLFFWLKDLFIGAIQGTCDFVFWKNNIQLLFMVLFCNFIFPWPDDTYQPLTYYLGVTFKGILIGFRWFLIYALGAALGIYFFIEFLNILGLGCISIKDWFVSFCIHRWIGFKSWLSAIGDTRTKSEIKKQNLENLSATQLIRIKKLDPKTEQFVRESSEKLSDLGKKHFFSDPTAQEKLSKLLPQVASMETEQLVLFCEFLAILAKKDQVNTNLLHLLSAYVEQPKEEHLEKLKYELYEIEDYTPPETPIDGSEQNITYTHFIENEI